MHREIGDNLHIDVRAKTRETFDLAIQIAMEFEPAVEAYTIDKKKGLVLLWCAEEYSGGRKLGHPFPTRLDAKGAADMAWTWLQKEWEKDPKDRVAFDPGGKPYEDGEVDNDNGFRVYNEEWGHVGDHTYSVCAIQPASIWIGK